MTKTYIVKYQGAVEIEAENEAEAEELAWTEEDIRAEDIVSIVKEKQNDENKIKILAL